jgi:hypothetical protein
MTVTPYRTVIGWLALPIGAVSRPRITTRWTADAFLPRLAWDFRTSGYAKGHHQQTQRGSCGARRSGHTLPSAGIARRINRDVSYARRDRAGGLGNVGLTQW